MPRGEHPCSFSLHTLTPPSRLHPQPLVPAPQTDAKAFRPILERLDSVRRDRLGTVDTGRLPEAWASAHAQPTHSCCGFALPRGVQAS
eukprot:358390-Chlamydomonas_euryale.AAC.9